MKIGIIKESFPGETRVALVPASLRFLIKQNIEILVEKGAGFAAGYTDKDYTEKGAQLCDSRQDVFSQADVIVQVRGYGSNLTAGQADLDALQSKHTVIAMQDPLSEPQAMQKLAEKGCNVFSMEMIPRITRAQSMDVLSSMATIAGYKAVLLAANHLPKMFPMMMTAAGTVAPAKVFVVGAGVAGLQAIASSKRLGAVVHAYDVRPAVKEQVESLGGKFVELDLQTESSETKGGYAKEMGEDFYKKQREMMLKVVAESDVVITTAAIPGKKSPILVTKEMVEGMQPGSVIIDLAAERGGNCELTQSGETINSNGVTIIGPLNIPSAIPYHASQMYSNNVMKFLLNMVKDGNLNLNLEDEIIKETLIAKEGKVVNERILGLL